MPQPPTLYDRLGGVYPIATVVDDFIDRIMVDARLNANPRVDEAHHRVPPPGFKYLVTEMVCWATGGPQKYTGRSMYDSHKDMKITGPRMGSVHGRFAADAGQVQCPRAGAGRAQGNRRQHARRHRRKARRGHVRLAIFPRQITMGL